MPVMCLYKSQGVTRVSCKLPKAISALKVKLRMQSFLRVTRNRAYLSHLRFKRPPTLQYTLRTMATDQANLHMDEVTGEYVSKS